MKIKEIKLSDDPFQTIGEKLEIFRNKINEIIEVINGL